MLRENFFPTKRRNSLCTSSEIYFFSFLFILLYTFYPFYISVIMFRTKRKNYWEMRIKWDKFLCIAHNNAKAVNQSKEWWWWKFTTTKSYPPWIFISVWEIQWFFSLSSFFMLAMLHPSMGLKYFLSSMDAFLSHDLLH